MPAIDFHKVVTEIDKACTLIGKTSANLSAEERCTLAADIKTQFVFKDELFEGKDRLAQEVAEAQMKQAYGADAGFISLRCALLNLLVPGVVNRKLERPGPGVLSACKIIFDRVALKLADDLQEFGLNERLNLDEAALNQFKAHLENVDSEKYSQLLFNLRADVDTDQVQITFWSESDDDTAPLLAPRCEAPCSSPQ